jgi:glycosyltransferase involved in cell wall biosynthesis
MGVRRSLLKASVREHLAHDLGPLRGPAAFGAYSAITALLAAGKKALGFRLLMRLHSAAFSPAVDRRIARRLARASQLEKQGISTGLFDAYNETVRASVAASALSPYSDPLRLVGSRILVVKTSRPGERGVLFVDYSYVFPLLAGMFDLPAIGQKYFLVLEPSWSGVCAPEILLFDQFNLPVFVETVEPRDHKFLESLHTNIRAVPVAANWWVDYRTIAPAQATRRDIDVIMIAAWGDIKRHARFFRTLARLRTRGRRLKVALVGYRQDRTLEDIAEQARYFGVADQVELFERISQEQIASLLARSRVHVLWSRRECANRAIIEAMLANVPVLVREGLTFGYKYPYINESTGRFVCEHDLGEAILHVLDGSNQYAPRDWVLQNMTCHTAASIVEERLRTAALQLGEQWSEGLVLRSSSLDTQRYWNSADRKRFEADYAFLKSMIRSHD